MKSELNFAKLLALFGVGASVTLTVDAKKVTALGDNGTSASFDTVDPKLGASNGVWTAKIPSESQSDLELKPASKVAAKPAPKTTTAKTATATSQPRSSSTHVRHL